jgi:hypothetical protein
MINPVVALAPASGALYLLDQRASVVRRARRPSASKSYVRLSVSHCQNRLDRTHLAYSRQRGSKRFGRGRPADAMAVPASPQPGTECRGRRTQSKAAPANRPRSTETASPCPGHLPAFAAGPELPPGGFALDQRPVVTSLGRKLNVLEFSWVTIDHCRLTRSPRRRARAAWPGTPSRAPWPLSS